MLFRARAVCILETSKLQLSYRVLRFRRCATRLHDITFGAVAAAILSDHGVLWVLFGMELGRPVHVSVQI